MGKKISISSPEFKTILDNTGHFHDSFLERVEGLNTSNVSLIFREFYFPSEKRYNSRGIDGGILTLKLCKKFKYPNDSRVDISKRMVMEIILDRQNSKIKIWFQEFYIEFIANFETSEFEWL